MKFGIMANQVNAFIPPGGAQPDPSAFVSAFDFAQHAFQLWQAGFNPIEINSDLALFFPHAFSETSIRGLKQLQDDSGVGYTVHLPLWSIEPSTPQEPVRRGSVEALVQTIQAAKPLDPEVYVLHATGALAAEFYQMNLPPIARAMVLRLFQARARESIRTVLEETGIPSRKLAVETIEFPLDLTFELAEELDLSICVDTGHILSNFGGSSDLFAVLERSRSRLAEIHLHDAVKQAGSQPIRYGLDHKPLSTGDLDTARLLNWIMEVGFKGPIVFELTVDEAVRSLQYIRELRPTWVEDTIDIKKWQSKLDTE